MVGLSLEQGLPSKAAGPHLPDRGVAISGGGSSVLEITLLNLNSFTIIIIVNL